MIRTMIDKTFVQGQTIQQFGYFVYSTVLYVLTVQYSSVHQLRELLKGDTINLIHAYKYDKYMRCNVDRNLIYCCYI